MTISSCSLRNALSLIIYVVADDLKILYNDWPYGIDKKIVHLCIWIKNELEDDPETKDLTPEMRKQIDEYVDKTFKSRVPAENVRFSLNYSNELFQSLKAMLIFFEGDLVQELELAEIYTFNGALPCNAE